MPGLAVALALLVALAVIYWISGALRPTTLPEYASSPRQITGMALMLILVPVYLVAAASLAERRSLALVEEIRAGLTDSTEADAAVRAILDGLRRTWLPGSAAGLAMGMLNTQLIAAFTGSNPILEGTISLGQLLMWWLVGLLLGVRIETSRAFRQLGAVVELDLFHLGRLRALARSGIIDVVIIAGALLLTPLQSLDAEFRWYNYQSALLVALPAAAFFLIWPLQPLHRRNRAERDTRLAAVESQLETLAPAAPNRPEASAQLEALLSHRDRLRALRTWPLSTGLLSRVALYLVIPPLAWAGAALVERVVNQLLEP